MRWLLVFLAGFAGLLQAARIPIHVYTTADGLPTSSAECITRDSRGFIWLCTPDGLVRFDGYTFVNYSRPDGTSDRAVTTFLEARDGAYWMGTHRAVAQFYPDAVGTKRPTVASYSLPGPDAAQYVTALFEDGDGAIWCGTRDGLYRKPPGGTFQAVEIGLPAANWKARYIQALAMDREDSLWVGTEDGLYRRTRAGAVERETESPCQSISAVIAVQPDQIWVGSTAGVCQFTRTSGRLGFAFTRLYTDAEGLPSHRVHALLALPDGQIWAGTEAGVGVLASGAKRFTPLCEPQGPAAVDIRVLGTDSDDNVWASATVYLMRIARSGFVTYTTSDGLGANQVTSIFEDRQQRLSVVNGIRHIALNQFDGRRFHAVRPRLVRGNKPIAYTGWGTRQTVLQDRCGDWWIATGEGLCRFSGVRQLEDLARLPPRMIYTRASGLPGDDIFRIFEDSHGDIWIATVDTPGLAQWQRQTGQIRQATARDGLRTDLVPASFAEDRAGDLWVGMFWKGVARYRQGRWRMFLDGADGPEGSVGVMLDHRGRLWISSTSSGILRVDDPAADNPRFVNYTTHQGLASDHAWSLTEDLRGRIYVGGERGIDVLEPDTGRMSHFSLTDGLALGDPFALFCDHTGAIWYGATMGLSRLPAKPEPAPAVPPVRITALRVAGDARPISALGATSLSGLQMEANENRLDVEFASINFRTGSPIRYQYRLRSAGDAWNELGEARAVHLDGLAPGSYEFQVRAVREGLVSDPSARIAFRILPPLWRRWWSITLMLAALASLLGTAYRFRVAQLVEMERVRTQIAMDLHDDIGSSLSQIAILSEVARKEAAEGHMAGPEPLTRMATISREVTSALGDIVWAINPRRDRLSDLVQRMRRFGGDLLNSRDIEFECIAPSPLPDTTMGADVRRQVFLVFKESVHNIARHSGCTRAAAELAVHDGQLRLAISDNGSGFRPEATDGNGLSSMRKRAEQIRGRLHVDSASGQGTLVLLEIPLHRRYPFRW